MELTEAVRSRRMTRRFDAQRQIPREQLRMLMKLAIRAPSAGHTQGWQFLILDDITSRARFWSVTASGAADAWRENMMNAPALVLCFADRAAYLDRYAEPDKGWTDRRLDRWPIPYWHVDVGMAAMILLLAAQDAGLGACFFGVPGERWPALRAGFEVRGGLDPVGVVALGHAEDGTTSRPLRRGRRPFDDVVRFASVHDPDRPRTDQSATD